MTSNENIEIGSIKTLSHLLNWSPPLEQTCQVPPLNDAFRSANDDRPRVLLCHDLMGNYMEDRFTQGFYSREPRNELYRFSHWSLIDAFCYFAHDLVSIPPIGWTTAAHSFGVTCLGTFIVEHWASYALEGDEKAHNGTQLTRDLLADLDQVELAAEKLAQIACFYQFDGWLVNMETIISIDSLPLMEHFLRVLTKLTHEATDGKGLVIWYDSVTADDGKLEWQNELNQRNESFYLACDGIFLNYCWNETKLARSKAREASLGRRYDCYVGVDVFGRGCPGGGQWNTCKAIELAYRHRLSVAIFAPAWTYESLAIDERPSNFYRNEMKFWLKLSPYFLVYEKKLCKLPLATNFCQGFGYQRWKDGNIEHQGTWLDLRQQSLQPSMPCLTQSETQTLLEDSLTWRVDFYQAAWNGGCCLELCQPITNLHHLLFRMSIIISSNVLLQLVIVYRFPDDCGASSRLVPVIVYNDREKLLLREEKEQNTEARACASWNIVKYCFTIREETSIELNELGFILEGQSVNVIIGFVGLDKT